MDLFVVALDMFTFLDKFLQLLYPYSLQKRKKKIELQGRDLPKGQRPELRAPASFYLCHFFTSLITLPFAGAI